MTTVLVTGGAGFIATHTDIELLDKGYDVISVDNYGNSSPVALERVEQITGKPVKRYDGDVRDEALMERVFAENNIDWVIHFAGLKAVGESVAKPIEYYDNNLYSTLVLLKVMKKHNVKKIIFSSSATVYGTPKELPITEETPTGGTTNPYGTSKLFQEQILRDVHVADPSWTIVLLRYFNPVGVSSVIGSSFGVPYTRRVFRRTSPRTWPRSRSASSRKSRSTATTTTRPTALVCVTTSTWSTWPRATWPSLTTSTRKACSSTTWVLATATPCLRLSRLTRRPPVIRFRTRSSRVAPVTSPPATPTLPRRRRSLAGRPS